MWYKRVNSQKRGNSSVGRAQPCQGWGREFEPRFPLMRTAISCLFFVCVCFVESLVRKWEVCFHAMSVAKNALNLWNKCGNSSVGRAQPCPKKIRMQHCLSMLGSRVLSPLRCESDKSVTSLVLQCDSFLLSAKWKDFPFALVCAGVPLLRAAVSCLFLFLYGCKLGW